MAVTGVTAYALFALAEVGLEIENVRLPPLSLARSRCGDLTLTEFVLAMGRRTQ